MVHEERFRLNSAHEKYNSIRPAHCLLSDVCFVKLKRILISLRSSFGSHTLHICSETLRVVEACTSGSPLGPVRCPLM